MADEPRWITKEEVDAAVDDALELLLCAGNPDAVNAAVMTLGKPELTAAILAKWYRADLLSAGLDVEGVVEHYREAHGL